MEHEYAVQEKKPTSVFIHQDVGELPSKDVDSDNDQNEKLNEFRRKVSKNRLVSFWSGGSDLEAKVITALAKAISDQPQTGWRKDSEELSKDALQQINKLSKSVDHWRNSWSKIHSKVEGFESLKTAQIELRFQIDDQQNTATFNCAMLIREFAYGLRDGLTLDEIEFGVESILRNSSYQNITKVDKRTIKDIVMFFEVFEIRELKNDILKISEDKLYLLKAAFQPLEQVINDEIPFLPHRIELIHSSLSSHSGNAHCFAIRCLPQSPKMAGI